MQLSIPIQQWNIHNINACDPVDNTILHNSLFSRLIYSDNLCTMTGIHIFIDPNEITFNKQHVSISQSTLSKLQEIEQELTSLFPQYTPHIEFTKEPIKYKYKSFTQSGLILRISGLWININNNTIGLNYKWTTSIPINFTPKQP